MRAMNLDDSKAFEALLSDTFAQTLHVAFTRLPVSLVCLTACERTQYETLSEVRRPSWCLGRAALHELLPRIGRSGDSSLLSFPDNALSLTHTNERAVAVGSPTPLLGLGIDLEDDRLISAKALRFYLSEIDQTFMRTESDPLRFWTIKEALFKADAENQTQSLTAYEILSDDGHAGQAICRKRSRQWSYRSYRHSQGFVSIALRSI